MNVTIKLKEEGGITQHSLFNAKVLTLAHGSVVGVTLCGEHMKADYRTTVEFKDGFHFEFTGFSWGYGGEGPSGLVTFMCDVCPGDRKYWENVIYNLPGDQSDYPLF
jgi:hypothetical protein